MLRWLFRACGVLSLAGSAGVLAFYGVSRTMTDAFVWSQFAFWVPGWCLLWPAWVLLGLGWMFTRVRRDQNRTRATRLGRLGGLARAGLLLAAVGATVHAGWVTRLDRALARLASGTVPWGQHGREPGAVRLVHWNGMAPDTFPREVTLPPILEAFDPDVMVFTMALSPWQADIVMTDVSKEYTRHSMGTFHILTRWPLRRAETRTLGFGVALPANLDRSDPRQLAPPPDEARHTLEYVYNVVGRRLGMPVRQFRNTDSGTVMELRFDAGERLGRDLVIWFIDLPSDPLLSKAALGERVRASLDALAAEKGQPDLVVGDFNIPRGSGSLVRMMGGRRSAFDDAGAGWFPTWPRAFPTLHIDQMFMGEGWRCERYERMNPGRSDHFVQAGEFGLTP